VTASTILRRDRRRFTPAYHRGEQLPISNLEIGVGSVITPKIFLDAALLVGLTRDTPDFTALISVPFRF
jgi:hypothetical protein